jgi:ubiquinone/menaquinone biosynthesis C-methylase UbiE
VRLSTRDRQGPGLRFVRGDATALPFPDASFDVVVNVESSHCYGSMAAFLAEASRVLRPAGQLLWADFRAVGDLPELRAKWSSAPLSLTYEEDITSNVMAALRLDDDHKRGLIEAWIPRPLHRAVRRFAATEGSDTFARFESGELRYLCARFEKTARPEGSDPRTG